jgi:thiol:disulfide interchange protein DsbD
MNMDKVLRHMMVRAMVACIVLLSALPLARGADDVDPFSEANRQKPPETDKLIKFTVQTDKREVRPGDIIRVTVTGKLAPNYHTYPVTQRTPDQKDGQLTRIRSLDPTIFKPLYPIKESVPSIVDEESAGILAEHEGQVIWEQDFLVLEKDAKDNKPITTGPKFINLAISLQVCSDLTGCVNGLHILRTEPITFVAEPARNIGDEIKNRSMTAPPATILPPVPTKANPPSRTDNDRPKKGNDGPKKNEDNNAKPEPPKSAGPQVIGEGMDLLPFLGVAIFWGALSLVTPCVFPMIPITVSFFIHQSEQKKGSPLLLAGVYSGTIALVLTLGGIFLLQILLPLSQHWATNMFLGCLFMVFALSLFGMYEIVLPSRLVNLTSSQEGRGGLVGTVFMALTFSLISFTCVAPFYGGFIALASSSSQAAALWSDPGTMLKLSLGALAYSVTFASPFFFLALFPSVMRALPKSGSWMNTVKVVMAFLEMAAAVKLLRAAELGLFGKAQILTYDFSLGIYVALAIACGLYLLNLYRLPHDHGTTVNLGVPRLLLSIAFLALGLYLLPGLFKQGDGDRQRPNGLVFSWMESFLLPDSTPGTIVADGKSSPSTASGGKLAYFGNFEKALARAEEERKLVFIDFTGEFCTNCILNENSVFTEPAIRSLLSQYVLVKLYCDQVPPEYQPTTSAAENLDFEQTHFGTAQRPLYVIVRPTGGGKFETVGVYPEAKINSVMSFSEFLKKPLSTNVAKQ